MPEESNFQFLQQEWSSLFDAAQRTEAAVNPDARTACFYARRALEQAVAWMYQNDPALKMPYDDRLSALVSEPTFKSAVRPEVLAKIRFIKEIGNQAVHSNKPIRQWDALNACKELWHFCYWFARTYTRQGPARFGDLSFDQGKLPLSPADAVKRSAEQIRQLEEELRVKDSTLKEKLSVLINLDAELTRLRDEVAQAKKQNETVLDEHDYSEAETRDRFIDLLLREAGWTLDGPNDLEYEVAGMPNLEGKGFVDYVLWGADGLPLAIVEAKRTKKSPKAGEQQAKLYADCLERQFNRRPIIFYTNGYDTWLWDDLNYPSRQVQGFYRREELELLVQRRKTRKDLASVSINPVIVERHYQIRAIKSINAALQQQQRKALLVMATGTGKTRAAIALVDLLQRCNWIKRTLFLADRVTLVIQTCNAFKAHLPDSSPVNLCTEKVETGSRVVVSTYQTMMNLVDEMDGENRRFGVGYFDLIIIDEAHRSVFNKFRAIFEYFDAYLVGLTATPKDEVDKNTYELFDLESGVPTDAYDLDDAVAEGFLVPPRAVSVPLKFQREGIRYDDLSDDEKETWDALEWGDEEIPDEVSAEAVNRWLFNADTVDKVLEHLVCHGIKVAGGNRLGKTIVFAKNHAHAEFIRERFDKAFPEFKGQFARVIDYEVNYVQTLIDDFATKDKMPHIAISVDMLDTGIDIPEVVNLVFFKIIRSKTKFFQMLGRGTRLCQELFGPGMHKECFCVFDFCQNFEFFRQNPKGIVTGGQQSLNAKLFLRRLELHSELGEKEENRVAETSLGSLAEFRVKLGDILHQEVALMNVNNFVVRPYRQQVERFSNREVWNDLSAADYVEAGKNLAGLPSAQDPEDELAKRFDLLMLNLQLTVLRTEPAFERLRKEVMAIASQLEEKQAIPMVQQQILLIQELQGDDFWTGITLQMLENVRRRIRSLVQFIDKAERKTLYTSFEDEIGVGEQVQLEQVELGIDKAQFRKKVMHFLRDHENHIALKKLKYNEPITALDLEEIERLLYETSELGDRLKFEEVYGPQPMLGSFVRKLIGLDREAAKAAFGEFLSETAFTDRQIRFINLIIDDLTRNGVFELGRLYAQPFTNLAATGPEELFDPSAAEKVISIIDKINANAAA
jgi:type I restriction enzyme, R subunit